MAQGDLYKVLKDVDTLLNEKGGTDLYRSQTIDHLPHELTISAAQIEREVRLQLHDVKLTGSDKGSAIVNKLGFRKGERTDRQAAIEGLDQLTRSIDFTANQEDKIAFFCENYARKILEYINNRKGKDYIVNVIAASSDTEYVVRIEKASPKTSQSVYNFLTKGDKAPLGYAKTTLRNNLSTLFKSLGNVNKNFELHLGHITAVSELQAIRGISPINAALRQVGTEVTKDLLKLELLSRFSSLGNPEFEKEFNLTVAYVRPESFASNITQSGYEKNLLNQVRAAVKEVIESNPSWAEQKGSDSVIDAISKELANHAKNRGAKVSAAAKVDTSTNKVSISRESSKKTVKAKDVPGKLVTIPSATSSPVDLRSLIPVLNQKLPDFVRTNMGRQGRLVNRSGRFAESTQIVDIDGDFITYSYMRSPYGVFEKQGARDPRPLIELSIRQMASEIMGNRFGMRRV